GGPGQGDGARRPRLPRGQGIPVRARGGRRAGGGPRAVPVRRGPAQDAGTARLCPVGRPRARAGALAPARLNPERPPAADTVRGVREQQRLARVLLAIAGVVITHVLAYQIHPPAGGPSFSGHGYLDVAGPLLLAG